MSRSRLPTAEERARLHRIAARLESEDATPQGDAAFLRGLADHFGSLAWQSAVVICPGDDLGRDDG